MLQKLHIINYGTEVKLIDDIKNVCQIWYCEKSPQSLENNGTKILNIRASLIQSCTFYSNTTLTLTRALDNQIHVLLPCRVTMTKTVFYHNSQGPGKHCIVLGWFAFGIIAIKII